MRPTRRTPAPLPITIRDITTTTIRGKADVSSNSLPALRQSSTFVPETAFGIWFLRTRTWEHHVLRVAITDLKRLIHAPMPHAPVIVDAGCGQGISFKLLAHAFEPSRIVGVDCHAPSLALAQSAEESGWGTSRVAQEGNALFGQFTWSDDGSLLPNQRGDGLRYRIAVFDQLMDCVKSYALNLNSHPAYDKFRRARAAQRHDDDALDGFALAGTLGPYSERGLAYVRAVRTIIRRNALDVFDHARLGDRVVMDTIGRPDA